MARLSFFSGPTYGARSSAVNTDRCINFIPEVNSPTSKADPSSQSLTLVSTPGINISPVTFPYPIQGVFCETQVFHAPESSNPFYYPNAQLIVVAQNIYRVKVAPDYTSTTPGLYVESPPDYTLSVTNVSNGSVTFLTPINGLIGIVEGGVVSGLPGMIITDGLNTGYLEVNSVSTTNISSLLPQSVTGAGKNSLCSIDGYVICISEFYSIQVSNVSAPYSWSGLAVQPASIEPNDYIQGIANYRNQLWIVGSMYTQVWYDAGIATSSGCPFVRIPGAIFSLGTQFSASIAVGADALFFYASHTNDSGSSMPMGVVMFNGFSYTSIMPPQITYMINNYIQASHRTLITAAALINAFCYSDEGHDFYVLNVVGFATFVYDVTTGLWHERNLSWPATQTDWGINCYCNAMGMQFVSGPIIMSGSAYALGYFNGSSSMVLGSAITSSRITPHLFDEVSQERITINKLELDLDAAGTPISPSSIVLSWSEDHGYNYSSTYTPSSLPAITQLYMQNINNSQLNVQGECFGIQVTCPSSSPGWILSEIYVYGSGSLGGNTYFSIWSDSSGSPGSQYPNSVSMFNWNGSLGYWLIPLPRPIIITPGTVFWIMGQDMSVPGATIAIYYGSGLSIPSAVATCTNYACSTFTVTTSGTFMMGVYGINSDYQSVEPARAFFTQLGSSRDRVARLDVSALSRVTLIGGYGDVSK